MDAASGRILYAQNPHQQLPPASLTKIMTGLLVMEADNLDKQVTISDHAARTPGSSIKLKAGEKLTREQLLYASMLHSANDATAALAESVGHSEAEFVEMMNNRARELRMQDTHFSNPHGLPAPQHHTSVYDLALLTRYTLNDSNLRKVMATRKTSLPAAVSSNNRQIFNRNRLLYRYQGAFGVKTGYTSEAGDCVVGAAKREGLELIAVALNSPRVYDDLEQILDYGFSHYQLTPLKKPEEVSVAVAVLGGTSKTVTANISNGLAMAITAEEKSQLSYKLLPKKNTPAPVPKGRVLGVCQIYINGDQVSETNLIASTSVAKVATPKSKASAGILYGLVGVMAVLLILFMFLKGRKV